MQQAVLTIRKDGIEVRQLNLFPSSETVIGRSPECTVVLVDDRASRKHAIVFCKNGNWYLKDLKSRNGTVLGSQIVNGVVSLNDGDQFWIGHCELELQIVAADSNQKTKPQNVQSDSATEDVTKGTGIFGISEAFGVGPSDSLREVGEIVERRSETSFFKQSDSTVTSYSTRTGHDSSHLCRLAYQLGKATNLNAAAKLTLEGLISATDAEAAGLWLLPQEVKSTFRVSQLRLVAHSELENQTYINISEVLAKTVLEQAEAILVNDRKNWEQQSGSNRILLLPSQSPTESNSNDSVMETNSVDVARLPYHTLVAPIRLENRMLGLIHLYNNTQGHLLTPEDLEYTLAVADTLAAALAHLTREKELSAHLVDVKQENTILREFLTKETEIIGVSPAMRQIGSLVARASEGKATLLIRGESGTGKELIARAAHFAGPRKAKPFVCLNCAAISESLLASELFGHEKGAFTGATERKIGKFEAANLGTLFLDEIGEMSPGLQAKFLRVLEGHLFERVGGNTPISVDVRVVAATNRDLEKEVTEDRFRHDLFFRLRVLEIIVPPLRKRKEDIPVLAHHFLERFRNETGRKIEGFSKEAMQLMLDHRWPGNVREIKNVIERAVLLGTDSLIQASDIMLSSLHTTGETGLSQIEKSMPKNMQSNAAVSSLSDPMISNQDNEIDAQTESFAPMTLEEWEKKHIAATLQYCDWNKSNAAKILGIERTTLDRKIKRYGFEK